MGKNKVIKVQNIDITISQINDSDYICLTDLAKGKEGEDHIRNWMRNRNTVEFIGLWEQMNNPNFKGVEFDTFKKQSGLNAFNMTPKKWVEGTNAIGVVSKSGRYGGTYAHKDIAFEFASWLSPLFKLYLIKEFQRLKEVETNEYNLEWDITRVLTKINYTEHTDAIKDVIIPESTFSADKQWLEYAEEADLLNVALFGYTASQWKQHNPTLALKNKNARDYASINELIVLSRLETMNSILIRQKYDRTVRFNYLKKVASEQLGKLKKIDLTKSIKRLNKSTYIDAKEEKNNKSI